MLDPHDRDPLEPEANRLPLVGVLILLAPGAVWLYWLFVNWFIGVPR